MFRLAAVALALALNAPAAAAPVPADARPRAAAPDVVGLRRPAEPEWFGIYVLGKKAGWSRSVFGLERRDDREVLVGRAETMLSATVGGRDVTRATFDEKVYEARPGGRLLSFTSRREGDGGTRTIEARCDPAACAVSIVTDGKREERKIAAPRETADDADATRLVAARRESRKGSQLDPDRLRDKQVETRFVRRATVPAAGVEVQVSIVEELEAEARAPTRASVADDGRVLEIRVGDSVVAKAEPEAVAKRLDRVDLFGLTRVKLPGALPRRVPATLRFRVRGLPPAFLKDDPRQQVTGGKEGEAVVTVTAARPQAADSRKDARRGTAASELLEATPEIDHDDPAIRALSAKLVAPGDGVYAAARKISDAVYRRLDKTYGSSRDRASEVLEAGKGDCTEHTLLFVALARASGVPARQVHGLVYARYQDGVDALYWHAWPEVRAGSEWIALDPTFGQPVADATHIALGRGTQVDTVGLLGAIQVLGVEKMN
jgi:transglutaminase-like putative cysteine protease